MADYDILIIGAGTGGLRASVIAAKSGYKTAVIEVGVLGGTCLNTGCIPTKTLIHAADIYSEIKNCSELGLKASKVSFDFSKVVGRMHDIVNKGRKGAEESLERIKGVTLIRGSAEFVSENSVKVGSEKISADKIIIATGSSPWTPPIKGLEDTGYLTNEEALLLNKLPKSMIMIGGGYIAIELACFFARMGTKVTVLERNPRILAMLDEDVTSYMEEQLRDLGIDVLTNIDILEVKGKNGKKATVKTKILGKEDSKETSYAAQYVLAAVGRKPNTKGLNLEKAGIELTERGHIKVDEQMKTSNSQAYAIGDVHGKSPFAHTVKREAKLVLENALLDAGNELDYKVIPWAIFSHPIIGGVGMSERQARKADYDVGVMKAEFSNTGKAKIICQPGGFVKVVYNKKNRNLLGAVIVGPDADNLIHEFALLLNTPDPKVDYILQTVHAHPTLAEVMEELKEVE